MSLESLQRHGSGERVGRQVGSISDRRVRQPHLRPAWQPWPPESLLCIHVREDPERTEATWSSGEGQTLRPIGSLTRATYIQGQLTQFCFSSASLRLEETEA